MKLESAWGIVKETANDFVQGPSLTLSAATAYYSVFSIAPLLVLVIGAAGLVFGEQQVRVAIQRQLSSYLGAKATGLIESMMKSQLKGGTLMATLVGAVALIFGATAVFSQLQDGLNRIWGVMARPGNSLWLYVRDRLLSLAMLLGVGFLLLVSMALSTFVNAFTRYISNLMAVPNWLAPSMEGVVSFLVTSLLFALIFKVLPDVHLRWRDVWIGSVVTALLFSAGKFLLGFYLGHEIKASAYGAGSAFVVILLYVYYASLIVFIGAVFTKTYVRRCGPPIQTAQYAIHLHRGGKRKSSRHRRRHLQRN